MPTENANPDDATQRRLRCAVAVGVLAIMLAFGGLAVVNEFRKPLNNKDYPTWYNAGRDAMTHSDIYGIHDGSEMNFTYPPFAPTCFYGPLTELGNHGFVIALVLIQSLAWAGAILLSVRLATGHAFKQHFLLYLLPSLVTLPAVWTSYQLGQANLMLLPLMLGGFVLLSGNANRRFLAGVLFAAAAAFKAFPVLVAIYLIWRRQWLALGGMAAGLVVCLLLLPGLFRGFDTAWHDLHTWTTQVAMTSNEQQIGQRNASWAYSRENQSLQASVVRLTHAMPFDERDGEKLYVNLVDLGFGGAKLAFILIGLGLAAGQAAFMPRRRDRSPATDAIEQAMVLTLITIASPLAWGYYFIWLLFPLTVALHHIGEMEISVKRNLWLAWWFAVGLCPLLAFEAPGVEQLHAAGSATWSAVALWAGLGIWLRNTAKSQAPAPRTPDPA